MNKLSLVFLIVLISQLGMAQDIIIKKNTDEIECKVVEIEEGNLKYRKFSNLDGPIYNISTDDIFMVKFENGEKEVFTTKEKTLATEETNNTNILPNRVHAIRLGYSLGNIFNTILVDDYLASITSNNNFAITWNSFTKNRRFSSSLTLAPFNIDSYNYGLSGPDDYTQEVSGYALLGEFYVHYGLSSKSSFYSGLGSGFMRFNRTLTYINSASAFNEFESLIAPSFHLTIVGSEYYFTPNIGLYSELGLGRKGILSTGVQFQF